MLHKGSPVVAVHVAPHSIGLLISQIMTSGSCCGTLEASVTHDSRLGEAGDDFRAEKLYKALHKKVSSCSHASGKVRNRMRRLCVQKLQGGTLFFVLTTNIVMCIILKEERKMQLQGRSKLASRKLYSKEEEQNCCGCCCCCPEMWELCLCTKDLSA